VPMCLCNFVPASWGENSTEGEDFFPFTDKDKKGSLSYAH